MASNLDVQNAVADYLVAQLAPYQPSVPPNFVNLSSLAGQIPSTVCGPGRPIQYPVTTTLEQGGAQIGSWFGKVGKPMPYIHTNIYQAPAGQTSGAVTNLYQETGRILKQFVIEIWAYKPEDRDALTALVSAFMGDAIRFPMPDGTKALLKVANEIAHDEEQADSIWITQLYYMADITRTLLVSSGADVGQGYIVTEVQAVLDTKDDQGNVIASYERDTP